MGTSIGNIGTTTYKNCISLIKSRVNTQKPSQQTNIMWIISTCRFTE